MESFFIEIIEQCIVEAITMGSEKLSQDSHDLQDSHDTENEPRELTPMDWSTADVRKHQEMYQSNWFGLENT